MRIFKCRNSGRHRAPGDIDFCIDDPLLKSELWEKPAYQYEKYEKVQFALSNITQKFKNVFNPKIDAS